VASAGGHVCAAGEPDAGTGGEGSPQDLDGDGIPNADDNCPEAPNGSQANEDGDAFGDACDPCPPFADNTDSDGDGVGDACDPNPQAIGDHIVFFEGFADGLPFGWMATGAWAVSGGELRFTAQDTELGTLVVPYPSLDHQTLSTIATITGLTATSGGSIGIVDRFDLGGTAGVHCGGGRSGDTELFALINAANGAFLSSMPHAFAVGTTYRLELRRKGNDYECRDTTPGAPLAVTANAAPNGVVIGFRARVASARYPWLLGVVSL